MLQRKGETDYAGVAARAGDRSDRPHLRYFTAIIPAPLMVTNTGWSPGNGGLAALYHVHQNQYSGRLRRPPCGPS